MSIIRPGFRMKLYVVWISIRFRCVFSFFVLKCGCMWSVCKFGKIRVCVFYDPRPCHSSSYYVWPNLLYVLIQRCINCYNSVHAIRFAIWWSGNDFAPLRERFPMNYSTFANYRKIWTVQLNNLNWNQITILPEDHARWTNHIILHKPHQRQLKQRKSYDQTRSMITRSKFSYNDIVELSNLKHMSTHTPSPQNYHTAKPTSGHFIRAPGFISRKSDPPIMCGTHGSFTRTSVIDP